MSPPKKYLTAVMLSSEIAEQISAIHAQYRVPRWKERIGPHITLNRPFTFSPTFSSPFDVMLSALSEVSKKHGPLSLRLDGAARFDNKEVTIFARVIPNPTLCVLQSNLNSAISGFTTNTSPDYGEYHPHVTLSNKLTYQEAELQFAEISRLPLHQTIEARCFNLLSLNPVTNTWETTNYFPLDAKPR